jgi:hypothetical protein
MVASSSTIALEGRLLDISDALEVMIISNALHDAHDFKFTTNSPSCCEVHPGEVCMCFLMTNFADKM